MNNEMILIIVRGLPGSGKSTFAELLGTKAICTADDYHTHKGVYNWTPEKVKDAHQWCQRKCRRFMKARVERIVVANTSTQEWELAPYYDMARRAGYTVYSVITENRHNGQNIHNVPEETLEKMASRFSVKLI
jgi:tRNA uridine 5-carbamoylmethylation protein Kti12